MQGINEQSASLLVKYLYELKECMIKDSKRLRDLYKRYWKRHPTIQMLSFNPNPFFGAFQQVVVLLSTPFQLSIV